MPIRQHLVDQNSFEPETIEAMSTAFALACADLKVFAGDDHGREIIATRIIELARNGLTDPRAVCERIARESKLDA
jgi:hypothetical protein